MPNAAEALMYYIVFLLSTTLHEAAHAWAAMRGGDLTAYHGGQVTLDPRPHIRREPFGMLILPLLSVAVSGWPFGYASAPYDPRWAMEHPRRAGWMALAGPASNLVLVLVAAAGIRIGLATGVFHAPASIHFGMLAETEAGGVWPGVAMLLGILFSLNLLLAIFNLFPVPPLDGSGAMPLFLGDRAGRKWQLAILGNPMLGLVGILVAWQLFGAIFGPVFLGAVNLLYPGAGYQ